MRESVRVYDISVPVSAGMITYPGDPTVSLERTSSIAAGAEANVSRLDFGVHSGTHIDAPVHFIDGAPAAEDIPLDVVRGPCVVVDALAVDHDLDRATLAGLHIPAGATRLLFKTGNSRLWGEPEFDEGALGITEDGARWLVERDTRLVAIDYLSIAPKAAPGPTHRVLLGAGVVVLEGVDLRAVEPGEYELLCLPVKLVGSDGAPARAILVGP